MRILLFLGTNIAVLVLISIIFILLGPEDILANNGGDLNLDSLLIFVRYREYRADAAGVQFAGSAGMNTALQRLKAEQGLPQDLPSEMTAFGIRSQTGSGFAALLRSHPPLDDRILALQTA